MLKEARQRDQQEMAMLKTRNKEVEEILEKQNNQMKRIKSEEDDKNESIARLAALEEAHTSDINLLRDHLCVCKIQLNQHEKTHKNLLGLISQSKENNKKKQSCLMLKSTTSTERQVKRNALLDEMTTLIGEAIRATESHPLDWDNM